ncbi:MAG: hypothetical protein IBX50_18535 [Marinospirillum sp.]|uniref:hypothetical protein n=1 Tax=Marinospirillum sp. TaxID=2183934 RepID=UPI001A0AEC32|nr:hypothetical protein [Marinospirillum sp.]MBE0508685.1 hypothetical protein [Marinospirillum sp.]
MMDDVRAGLITAERAAQEAGEQANALPLNRSAGYTPAPFLKAEQLKEADSYLQELIQRLAELEQEHNASKSSCLAQEEPPKVTMANISALNQALKELENEVVRVETAIERITSEPHNNEDNEDLANYEAALSELLADYELEEDTREQQTLKKQIDTLRKKASDTASKHQQQQKEKWIRIDSLHKRLALLSAEKMTAKQYQQQLMAELLLEYRSKSQAKLVELLSGSVAAMAAEADAVQELLNTHGGTERYYGKRLGEKNFAEALKEILKSNENSHDVIRETLQVFNERLTQKKAELTAELCL